MPALADYWKSNARKYCEFCKCWITDNKISVAFHEDGKRHKDNVAKKISEITKKSAKDHKERLKIDKEMAKMEKVAMAAYLKDVENNADLTSKMINEKLAESNRTIGLKKNLSVHTAPASSSKEKKLVWQEAKAENGNSYYWNTDTNEVSWDPPDEEYISFAELHVKEKQGKTHKVPPKAPKMGKKNKAKNKNKKKKEALPANTFYVGEQPRVSDPYGGWKPVENKSQEVDLQLPEQRQPAVVAPLIALPVEKQFKEKQISSLGENDLCETGFKKRKINSNIKRNVRQRVEDD